MKFARPTAALLCLAACGCSVMRELPREQYARVPERGDTRVETRGGVRHDFERVRVGADSLVGYEHTRAEGSFEEFREVPLSLEEVSKFSVRSVDWYRTGLIGGVALGVVLGIALTQSAKGKSPGDTGPCPRCPR